MQPRLPIQKITIHTHASVPKVHLFHMLLHPFQSYVRDLIRWGISLSPPSVAATARRRWETVKAKGLITVWVARDEEQGSLSQDDDDNVVLVAAGVRAQDQRNRRKQNLTKGKKINPLGVRVTELRTNKRIKNLLKHLQTVLGRGEKKGGEGRKPAPPHAKWLECSMFRSYGYLFCFDSCPQATERILPPCFQNQAFKTMQCGPSEVRNIYI